MAGFTSSVLLPNGWLLFCPVPWIFYSMWLSIQKLVTMEHLLVFTGTLVLAASIVVSLVAVACILPWLPIRGNLGQ